MAYKILSPDLKPFVYFFFAHPLAISFELSVNELFWGKLTSAVSCAALLRNFRHCIYSFVLQIDIFMTNHDNFNESDPTEVACSLRSRLD